MPRCLQRIRLCVGYGNALEIDRSSADFHLGVFIYIYFEKRHTRGFPFSVDIMSLTQQIIILS